MVKAYGDWVGALGEYEVMLELAKRKVLSLKMDKIMDFDLLTEFGERIEVKSSKIIKSISGNHGKKGDKNYYTDIFSFVNQTKIWVHDGVNKSYKRGTFKQRDRICDFFIFVCMDKDNNPIKYYVVPKQIIGTRRVISIPKERKTFGEGKFDLEGFKNRWDLIKGVEPEVKA